VVRLRHELLGRARILTHPEILRLTDQGRCLGQDRS
jgi:hypothetical protein